jgi:hypothetical protein
VETQWDRLSGLSDDAWKGVPKGVFPQAFQLQEHPRIMWNAKKLSYACKKFVERQNCDATILHRAYQSSDIVVEIVRVKCVFVELISPGSFRDRVGWLHFFGIIYMCPDAENANALLVTIVPYQGFMSQTDLLL